MITGSYYNLEFADGKVNGHFIIRKMSTLLDDKLTTVKTRNQKVLLKDVDADRFVDTMIGQFKVDRATKLRPLVPNEARETAGAKTIDFMDVYTKTRTTKVREMTPQEVRAKAKSDPEYRKKLMLELMELEDEEMENNNE